MQEIFFLFLVTGFISLEKGFISCETGFIAREMIFKNRFLGFICSEIFSISLIVFWRFWAICLLLSFFYLFLFSFETAQIHILFLSL
jgi:hypothetical protein